MTRSREGRPRGRTCTRCRQWRPAWAFRPNPRLRGGLGSWCRPCHVRATREWRAQHADDINSRRRARRAQDAAWREKDLASRRRLYAERSLAIDVAECIAAPVAASGSQSARRNPA